MINPNVHPLPLHEDPGVMLELAGAEGAPDLSRLVQRLTSHFEEADYAELLRVQHGREALTAQLYWEMRIAREEEEDEAGSR